MKGQPDGDQSRLQLRFSDRSSLHALKPRQIRSGRTEGRWESGHLLQSRKAFFNKCLNEGLQKACGESPD
jgi:hypothetical protein